MVRLGRSPRGFLMLAVVAAAFCWSLGLLLAPDRQRFLASPEWHYQPFYLAVHIAALQLFFRVYRINFNHGVGYLETAEGRPAEEIREVLPVWAVLLGILVAAPFAAFELVYLFSDRYEKMGGDGIVRPIDLVMWSIWCTEWVLNALIWIVLLGFLIRACRVIQTHRFKAPIEIVLHERHYRPLLRMSAQGATVLVGFAFATIGYIWYADGELTDYIGLAITGILLLVGFVTPWLLLQSKVDKLVREEMAQLRRQLAIDMQRSRFASNAAATPGSGGDAGVRAVEHRLDVVLAMLRITYLEHRHDKVGQTEARAVVLRLLAPIATIAWQFRQHSTELLQNFGGVLQSLMGKIGLGG